MQSLYKLWGINPLYRIVRLAAIFLLTVLITIPLIAADQVVTSSADAGAGTLRDAIAAVGTGELITFNLPAGSETIVLTSGELAIDKSLTIDGDNTAGSGVNITISGNNAVRVLNIGSVTPAINVTLTNLIIANGNIIDFFAKGGGILNASTGTLNITTSTINGNSATGTSGGNSGGSADGGGILNASTGTVNITNSTLSNNSSVGGTGTDFDGSSTGGGISNLMGTVNITNSTISSNLASGSPGTGGAVSSFVGTVNVTNSTISLNSSLNGGGGIHLLSGTLNLTNSTITGNSDATFGGGGILINGAPTGVNLKNTIIAQNTAPTAPEVLNFGVFTSLGYNLFGKGVTHNTCCGGSINLPQTGDQVGTLASPIDPLLGSLQDNGGPTFTHALLIGSPAIDLGDCGTITEDQRGITRPQGAACDIGAFELGAGTIIIKKITNPASTGIDFSFSSSHFLTVNTPAGIVGTYIASYVSNGPPLDLIGVTGNLVLVNDGGGSGTATDGCEALVNGAAVAGNIAVIDRGECSFNQKLQNAFDAGAIAAIVINNNPGQGIINMGATTSIPSIFISYEDGQLIKAQLPSPGVNATLHSDGIGVFTLQHNQMKTVNNLPAGTYTVTEEDPLFTGYSLTDITFVDPDGGSSGDVGTGTATIDLDPGETVEVTFTNGPCTLEPPTDTKPLNQSHTVTFDLGIPVVDIAITFTVVSGPNIGETATINTDVNGIAEFTYIGDGGPGTDNIEANVENVFICYAEVTWEQEFPFMTIWAVNDHTDGKLQYYTLDVASPFLNIEGNIVLKDALGNPINDDKDLEDLIIDSSPTNETLLPNDGTFYIVNNVGTSKIYKINYGEIDGIEGTDVNAVLVLDTGLPTNPNTASPEEISSLLVYNGTLYALSKAEKKLYVIDTDALSITQVATLDPQGFQGEFRSDGMTYRPYDNDNGNSFGPTINGTGTVYLLRTVIGGPSEIWKFDEPLPNPQPGATAPTPLIAISKVCDIIESGKVEALTAHPDGYLYASDQTRLYRINVENCEIAYLADYTVDIEGMDYFYELELIIAMAPTRQFIPIAPTPVELVSFAAEAKSGKVVLNWQTATEVNNYGFDILRQSARGGQDDQWTTLAFVDGYGNSNSPKSYSFTDNNPTGGTKFSYRLKQIDNDGTYEYSDIVEVEFVPTEYALYQNYPNPFNPATNIKYNLPQETAVTIKVFDILGEEVMTVVNEKQEAGSYEVSVDGSNLGSGIYFYHMQAGAFSNTKKMLILK